MPESRFIHLRLHSEYSITDGIVRLDDAVARAVSYGMPALALTDLANFFGLVKFYSSARGMGSSQCSARMCALPTRQTPIDPIDCCCFADRGRGTCNSASC